MLEKALEFASRITDPITLTAFMAVFLGTSLVMVVKMKNRPVKWLLVPVLSLTGLAPLAARTYLASRGIFRIAVVVLNDDNLPMKNDVEVSSAAGEKKITDAGWEFDIPVQARPTDGRVTIYAKAPSAFLAGQTTVILNNDYYPFAQIRLAKVHSVTIRGEVIDEKQRTVADAEVMLPDCSQSTRTDSNGLFALNSCVAEGQMVRIRSQKSDRSASMTVIAGQTVELLLPTKP